MKREGGGTSLPDLVRMHESSDGQQVSFTDWLKRLLLDCKSVRETLFTNNNMSLFIGAQYECKECVQTQP